MRATLAVWVSFALLSSCASTVPLGDVGFLPIYVSSAQHLPKGAECAGTSGIDVTDKRPSVGAIGARVFPGEPPQRFEVRLTGDVAGWAKDGWVAALRRSGIGVDIERRPQLKVQLTGLELNEEVGRMASYRAKVALDLEALPQGAPPACWQGSAQGEIEFKAQAGVIENHREALNRALDKAIGTLLTQERFTEVLCGRCQAAAPL
jgi:hypothetical protein